MFPRNRLGRAVIVLAVAGVVCAATVFATAPGYRAEDDLVALAPEPAATVEPVDASASESTSTLAVAAAPTATAVATRTVISDTQFERVLRPLLNDAKRRRQAQAADDPTYWTRNDPRLNSTRLNFLLFGYGETHEPPLTERAFIGSLTIFSYDYASKHIDLVSLTHDIRAPEVERYLRTQGQQSVGPIKIDRAYGMGGFDLMRRTLEDATGLAIDYQLAFREAAIASATDNVFGGLDVQVPMSFKVNGFYLDGVKYPGGEFQQGTQKLNGVQVIQFIKTVPVEEHYDAALEHNARKHLVFKSLMDALRTHSSDVTFLGKAALFFSGQVAQDSIAYDFDLKSLLVDNMRGLMTDFARPSAQDDDVPSVNRTLYVVDPASGDGGVQWVQANAHDNPVTQQDIAANVYKELAIEVPYHGNPYADDLPGRYWSDVRNVVATKLRS